MDIHAVDAVAVRRGARCSTFATARNSAPEAGRPLRSDKTGYRERHVVECPTTSTGKWLTTRAAASAGVAASPRRVA